MFNNAFSQILPAGEGFGVVGVRGCGENVCRAEMRAEALGNDGPAHEFGDCEGFEEFFFFGDEGVAGVGVDAVEEVRLFVVVWCEEDVEDYSLKDLQKFSFEALSRKRFLWTLTACSCSGVSSTDSVSKTCR